MPEKSTGLDFMREFTPQYTVPFARHASACFQYTLLFLNEIINKKYFNNFN